MQLPSVMKHDFSKAPQAVIPRSSFNLSFGYKTTFNAGYLIPFFCKEILPGDTFNVKSTVFIRLSTLLFPLMDNIHIDIQYFFISKRILWDNYEKFMGFQQNPGDSISYIYPTVTSVNTTDFNENTIYDYLGIATKKANVSINSLPLRAINKIWNDWYRDENLQNSVIENLDDGPDSPSDYTLLRRGKRHDYFTSSLPTPQKGTAVELPLGTTAPVLSNLTAPTFNQTVAPFTTDRPLQANASTNQVALGGSAIGTSQQDLHFVTTGLYADLSSATAATINDLRLAVTTQHWQERAMRGGSRLVETIWSHFGVHTGDARLQRPELLSTYTEMMNINVVPQTSGSGATGQSTPQGNLAGYGTAVCHKAGFLKSFVEPGYVIGFISARADLTYQQGTDRMWYSSTKFDDYWPEFANLGEQAVLMREIYTLGTSDDLNVWGYQEAWAHYRQSNSKVTGLFRTNATGTLDSWHLAQDLSTPALNATFIVDNPPMTRIKANSSDPDFLMDTYHHVIAARPLPMYSEPGVNRL